MKTQRTLTRAVTLILSVTGVTLLTQAVIKRLTRRSVSSPVAPPPATLPPQPVNPPGPPVIASPVESRPVQAPRAWWQRHRLEIASVLGLIAFGLFLWWASPPADIDLPAPNDLPFDVLHPARQFMLDQVPNAGPILLIAGASVLAVLWVIALRQRRVLAALSATLIILSVGTALYAQALLMTGQLESGTVLYALAGILLLIWALWRRPSRAPSASEADRIEGAPVQLSRRLELALVMIVMVVTRLRAHLRDQARPVWHRRRRIELDDRV